MAELLWILVYVLFGVLFGNVLFSWGKYSQRLPILRVMAGMAFGFGLFTIFVPQFFPGLVYFLISSSQAAILILTTGFTIAYRALGIKK